MKKRVLIVSFKIGLGHYKAAEAIEEKLRQNHPELDIKHVDMVDYISLLGGSIYQKGYLAITDKAPELWRMLYHQTPAYSAKLRLIFDLANTAKFRKLIFAHEPDLVICTHFIPASLLSHWRETLNLETKLAFILTDFESHPHLIIPGLDLYSVAADSVKHELVKNKIDSSKIAVTGIPVKANFTKTYEKSKIRQKLGLKDKFTVLLMSGGFGVGEIEDIFSRLQESTDDLQIVAVAGYNKELEKDWQKVAKKSPKVNKIFGFTDQVAELMASADVIVSKAGGLTVSESLCIGTPLVIFKPTPGQEEANTRYLVSRAAAYHAETVKGILNIINRVFLGQEDIMAMKKNIAKIAKPHAAEIVALKVVDLIK